MDDLLSSLQSFPPEKQCYAQEYDKQAIAYVKQIAAIPPAAWRTKSDKKTLLDLLKPARHSIPYLFCLLQHLKTPSIRNAELTALLPYVAAFFHQFDPVQIRYVGTQWTSLFSSTADVYRTLRVTDVSTLGTGLLRLDPTAGTFTSNHLTYLVLCLQAGTPSRALSILDKNIYTFPSDNILADELLSSEHEFSNTFITEKSGFSDKLTCADVLEYYLLGAHVYLSLRRWSRARLFLEFVILHPSPHGTTSELQVEAYKKWVLAGLLSSGKTFTYPRTAGQQVMKNIKAVARPYDALAETFEKRNWRKFQAAKDVGSKIWRDDGNARLVNEAGAALLRYCVSDLQKTYAALPISSVAKHLDLPTDETFNLVTGLIQQGQLAATIDHGSADATLRFVLASDSTKIEDVSIQAQAQRIEELLQHVRDANRRLQLTQESIDVARRSKRTGGDSDPADQMDLEWNNPGMPIALSDDDGDEDIMA